MKEKKELWIRIRDYQFSDMVHPNLEEKISAFFNRKSPMLFAFADKISRKHKWKRNFSVRAIHEYKKFTYLAVLSQFQVTPSKVIDIVWHEHILFSRGYRSFCTGVLRYELDHHPELFPMEELTDRYSQQFNKTLNLYRKEFGEEPPSDIWGITKYMKDKDWSDAIDLSSEVGDSYGDPICSLFEGDDGQFGGGGASGFFGDHDSIDGDEQDSGDSGDSGSSCSSGCSSGCGGD